MLRPTASRRSYLCIKLHLGPRTVFLSLGCLLWRDDGSVVYNCCWSSSAQSYLLLHGLSLFTVLHATIVNSCQKSGSLWTSTIWSFTCNTIMYNIKGTYTRMVRFKELLQKLFLTQHGHNIHCQERKLSTFLMRYSSSLLLMLNAGQSDQFPRWRRSRSRLSVCSVSRCPDVVAVHENHAAL
jgi:hypothetical protein